MVIFEPMRSKTDSYEALFGLDLCFYHVKHWALGSLCHKESMSLLDAPRWLQIASVVCVSIGPLLVALRWDPRLSSGGLCDADLSACHRYVYYFYIRGKEPRARISFQLRVNRPRL